jgi:hypothetical protein
MFAVLTQLKSAGQLGLAGSHGRAQTPVVVH